MEKTGNIFENIFRLMSLSIHCFFTTKTAIIEKILRV